MSNESVVPEVLVSARRSKKLIANFTDGYAAGWAMAVGECFKAALDICWMERKVKGESVWEWTQGTTYDFHIGDILYDIPRPPDSDWQNAPGCYQLMVQVIAARPAYLYPASDEAEEKKKLLCRYPGRITFQECRPNEQRQPKPKRTIDCTQDDFVAFLQTGTVKTLAGEEIRLLEGKQNQPV